MADQDLTEEEAPPSNKGFKIFAIVAVVAILGGGAGAYFAFGNKAKVKKNKDTMGPTLAVDSLIVNLDEPGGNRYLKTSIILELEEILPVGQDKLLPRLRDKILIHLSSLTVGQAQKKQAKEDIKKQLVVMSNGVFGKGTVKQVYFKEFVIQ